MKPRICPNCKFRNFTDNLRCSRCDELLLPTAGYHSSSPVPMPNPTTTIVPSPIPAPPPIPIPSPSPIVPGSSSSTTIPVPISPPPLTIYPPAPLPSNLLKLPPPIVEGEVEDPGQDQNEDKGLKAGDILHIGLSGVLLVANPIYGLMSIGSRLGKPKEYKRILTFRVKNPNNDVFDIRVEKEMVGASIRLGDYLSVWGRMSGGVVVLEHAYNHSVRGEVRLR
jgi:hypothetical protein